MPALPPIPKPTQNIQGSEGAYLDKSRCTRLLARPNLTGGFLRRTTQDTLLRRLAIEPEQTIAIGPSTPAGIINEEAAGKYALRGFWC